MPKKKRNAAILSSLNELQLQVASLQSQLLPSHSTTSKAMAQHEPHSLTERREVKVLELRERASDASCSDEMFGSLFDRARMQFLLRDWGALAAIDVEQISEHEDRAKLALLSATGLANTERLGEAQSALREALRWGCSPKLAASLLVSTIHNSLARAHLAMGQDARAQQHNNSASESSLLGYTPRLSSSVSPHDSVTPHLPAVVTAPSATGVPSTFFIKQSYIHRKSYTHFNDTPLSDEYQDGVYRHARALADKMGIRTVFDIGCGSGFKLIKYFSDLTTVGSEIEPTLGWLHSTYPDHAWIPSDFSSKPPFSPDLIICSDVIEHLVNPNVLLEFVAGLPFKHLVLSTPERDATQMMQTGHVHDGPPQNPCHVREWSYNELRLYLSHYFRIDDHLLLQNPLESRAICQVIVCSPLG
jgi:hypothetical protein